MISVLKQQAGKVYIKNSKPIFLTSAFFCIVFILMVFICRYLQANFEGIGVYVIPSLLALGFLPLIFGLISFYGHINKGENPALSKIFDFYQKLSAFFKSILIGVIFGAAYFVVSLIVWNMFTIVTRYFQIDPSGFSLLTVLYMALFLIFSAVIHFFAVLSALAFSKDPTAGIAKIISDPFKLFGEKFVKFILLHLTMLTWLLILGLMLIQPDWVTSPATYAIIVLSALAGMIYYYPYYILVLFGFSEYKEDLSDFEEEKPYDNKSSADLIKTEINYEEGNEISYIDAEDTKEPQTLAEEQTQEKEEEKTQEQTQEKEQE